MNEFSVQASLNQLDHQLMELSELCSSCRASDYHFAHAHGYMDSMFQLDVLDRETWYLLRDTASAWMDFQRTEKLLNQDVPDFLKRQAE